jgi:hypothetical protein
VIRLARAFVKRELAPARLRSRRLGLSEIDGGRFATQREQAPSPRGALVWR